MKFLCPSCKAKYQISDEKVAGRTVRMKCRKCDHVITVVSASEFEADRRIAKAGAQLSLADLGLTQLPPSLFALSNLRTLDISNNPLQELPSQLEKLKGLRSLSASKVGLTQFPGVVCRMGSLRSLDLASNRIGSLRDEMQTLAQLERLDLRGNQVKDLSPVIGCLRYLDTLDISDNQISDLPRSIGELLNLVHLDISNNALTRLPETLGNLMRLEVLVAHGNELAQLPTSFTMLSALRQALLSGNRFRGLPDGFDRLRNLAWLELADNRLELLPDSLCKAVGLTHLSLENNALKALPKHMRDLERLRFLGLHGNPELKLPPELLGPTSVEVTLSSREPTPPADILSFYFRSRSAGTRALLEAKVLVVGQGAVGKTSLVRRLVRDEYDPHELKTDGIRIETWSIPELGASAAPDHPERAIQLNIWDFGGQEIMHATHQFFLTKRSLYLLVLDARKGENECNIHHWLKIIQSYGADSPVIVVTNKCDGSNQLTLNETRLAKDFGPTLKGFFQVSCQNRNGLAELRQAVMAEIRALPHVYDQLPVSYFQTKDRLELEARGRDFLDMREFEQICEGNGIQDGAEQRTLLRFLHDLGNVLNFDEPDAPFRLRDTNILNPEWVTTGVYRLLNNVDLAKRRGILRREDLTQILDATHYPVERLHIITEMMRKFQLCFEFPDAPGDQWLIPELLSPNEPDHGYDELPALHFQYHYEVLPRGILPRFIVRMHAYLTKRPTYWLSGVVLEIDGSRALVRADTEAGRVFISVFDNHAARRAVLSVIRDSFRRIHLEIPRLEVAEKVPLPDQPSIVVDYTHLVRLERSGEETCWPEGAPQPYSVRDLLTGIEGPQEREKSGSKIWTCGAIVSRTPSYSSATAAPHPLPLESWACSSR
ncbi:MAG: COR domain-containing protein [Polyangiaceae bacterium]